MADDRNTEPEENGQKRPSRPVTAAARRDRRAAARPTARKDAEGETAETTAKPSPKGKTGPATKDKAQRAARAKGKAESVTKAPDAKGRPTRSRDESKAARPGLLARGFRFLREVVSELRKVIWPTRKQMITYTTVVLVFLAVMTALIWAMDIVLIKGVTWLFG
ncbi:preprotein translocase subunit SecE [Actinophytocola sp.]|uniref:preprotein translocase subunit SecE n=1 Tax=Actinophytocola sp. TaxID=1872138 RepID=UPI002D7E4E05|nr:preprotein translocase subunit SecE [Actinophytocola sp.]HET9141088.1 preprotein translocase subunit SecE [Actinophytocola sp.]